MESSQRNTSTRLCEEAGDAISQEELVGLWKVAQREVRKRCMRTLARLRRGEGDFYTEEDFWQDLFLEFWELVQEWHAHWQSHEELWLAWRKRLWGGGIRVLKRTPQRLWSERERPVDPSQMALADSSNGEGDTPEARSQLPLIALESLIQPEDAEAARTLIISFRRLEDALWTLRPIQRQMIYMTSLAHMSAGQVADCLGLRNANCVYQRLHAARNALRQCIKETHPRETGHQKMAKEEP